MDWQEIGCIVHNPYTLGHFLNLYFALNNDGTTETHLTCILSDIFEDGRVNINMQHSLPNKERSGYNNTQTK